MSSKTRSKKIGTRIGNLIYVDYITGENLYVMLCQCGELCLRKRAKLRAFTNCQCEKCDSAEVLSKVHKLQDKINYAVASYAISVNRGTDTLRGYIAACDTEAEVIKQIGKLARSESEFTKFRRARQKMLKQANVNLDKPDFDEIDPAQDQKSPG
jgi:hypothetical protein